MKYNKTLKTAILTLITVISLLLSVQIYNSYITVNDDNNIEITKEKNEITIQKSKELIEYEVAESKRIERERIIAEKKAKEEAERKEKERLAKLEEERLKRLKEKENEVVVSRGNSSGGKSYVYEVTFYSADYASTGRTKDDPYYGITASGTKAQVGRTIACPKSIPFGTKVHIEGFGYRICEDRGGAIKGKIVDVFVSSEAEAYRLGRQKLKVTILN